MKIDDDKTFSIVELDCELFNSDPDLYQSFIDYIINKDENTDTN